jgi:hypothetical protein
VLDQEFSGIALLWKGKMVMGVSKTGTSSVFQPEHVTLTTQALITLRNFEYEKRFIITHTKSSRLNAMPRAYKNNLKTIFKKSLLWMVEPIYFLT